jgi:hypothetical protein
MIDYSLSPYATGITDPYLAEEERKRKEREAIAARMESEAMANPIGPVAPEPVKETRTIDPVTGETKIKIEGNERDLSSANPNTPTLSTAKAPVSPQQFNQQQYNASIGAQESGNRPNIGFHDRSKGTAYGQYGITDAAYQDARKLNPSLPQDKTQATPEQQTQAMNAVTANNAKYLQGYGIEPNQNTLAAAHFLGAKGLNDFMTKKDEQGRPYISPQAQAANGGYDKAAAIANARLGGQASAASGATNRPTATPGEGVAVATGQGVLGTQSMRPAVPVDPTAPEQSGLMPSNQGIKIPGLNLPPQTPTALPSAPNPTGIAIQKFQDNQDNLDSLMQMRNDTNLPEHIRKRSGDRAYELMNNDYKKNLAQAKYDEMVQNGDQLGLARAISGKPKDEEGSFLKMIALGFISPQLAGQEAIKLGLAPTTWEQKTYTDKEGNEVAVEVQKRADGKIMGGTKSDGTALTKEELNIIGTTSALGKGASLSAEVYVDPTTGNRYRSGSDASGKAAMVNIQGGPAYRGDPKNLKIQSIDTATQKAENAAAVKLRYAGPTSYTEAGAKAAGEFNFNNGTNIGYASQAPGAPLVDLNTGKPVQVGPNGVINVTQTGTPGASVAAGGATPQSIAQGQAVSKVAQEQFVKTTVPALIEAGNNGRDIASIRRQQLDIIGSNPSILNIYNGTGTSYDRARNVISKVLTGAYNENNSDELYKAIKATGLGEGEQGAIEQMWNLTSSINSKTLKANTGGGPISNADMRTNQAANLQNFTETTPLGALQVMNRSKFTGDLDAAKGAFIAANPGLNDDTKFNSAWSKESSKYTKAYEGIAQARADFLKPYRPPADASKEQLAAFRDKVFKSFEMYPVPAYNAESNSWTYGTANAERAVAKKLLGR